MKRKTKKTLWNLFASGLIVCVTITGCTHTGQAVKPGMTATVHYTCASGGRGVVATTEPHVISDREILKADFFQEPSSLGPVEIRVLHPEEPVHAPGTERQLGFEEHIKAQLSKAVCSLKTGKRQELVLQADTIQGLSPDLRFHRMSRERKRSKQVRMQKELFLQNTGREPVAGEEVPYHEGFKAIVEEVNGDEARVRISAVPGTTIETDLGPAVIEDRGDHYAIVVEALEGSIVRVGNRIGRIIKTEPELEIHGVLYKMDAEKIITIDLGHPFGGETLKCDVLVESVRQDKEKEN